MGSVADGITGGWHGPLILTGLVSPFVVISKRSAQRGEAERSREGAIHSERVLMFLDEIDTRHKCHLG